MTSLITQMQGLSLSRTDLRLPVELFRDIFVYMPSMRDLCRLSLVSRDLQGEAEFFIYRSIRSTNRAHTEYLCDIITSSPHRHMLVRSLNITNDDWDGTPITPARDRDYWERIARLLHDLPYLQDLKINDVAMQTGNKNAWVLSRSSCSLEQFDSDFVFDKHLLGFIRSQRKLQRLYWTESFSDDDSARALDNMNLLEEGGELGKSVSLLNTNSPRFALKCIKGANLSHIWICGPCAHEDDGWLRYMDDFVAGGRTQNLTSLRMNLPYRKRTLIAVLWTLAKTTPNLRSLGFLPYFTCQDKELVDVLSQFKKLHSIVIWNVVERNTSHAVADACPSLRFIACLHYSYSHEYVLLPVNPLGTPRPLHDPNFLLWKDV